MLWLAVIIAQATRPCGIEEFFKGISGLVLALGGGVGISALVVALAALKKAGTNTQNIQTVAASGSAVARAQNASPGPCVSPDAVNALNKVASDPNIKVSVPENTAPIHLEHQ